ncbi:hypothetical protein DYBT9623_00530 [Dyadobacter sp. CECT 9623]|uniref:Uncharacterized protein n=1 Tax=Dyadobacter linearis TaxID=2823330 RepID=A0ABM8UJX8_9BACT|nr:hypothetical protein DYBT9623_00530 [Dyadobacter sp. CECT 9623]
MSYPQLPEIRTGYKWGERPWDCQKQIPTSEKPNAGEEGSRTNTVWVVIETKIMLAEEVRRRVWNYPWVAEHILRCRLAVV